MNDDIYIYLSWIWSENSEICQNMLNTWIFSENAWIWDIKSLEDSSATNHFVDKKR